MNFFRYLEDKGHWFNYSKRREVNRWLLTFFIGLICSIVAILVTYFTKCFTSLKYYFFRHALEREKNNSLPFGSAFCILCVFNILYVFIAWFTVFLEPLSAGSGNICISAILPLKN